MTSIRVRNFIDSVGNMSDTIDDLDILWDFWSDFDNPWLKRWGYVIFDILNKAEYLYKVNP